MFHPVSRSNQNAIKINKNNKMTSKKKDLYNLADGWLELESDPGLFTLLLEDMGVEGTQVCWTRSDK